MEYLFLYFIEKLNKYDDGDDGNNKYGKKINMWKIIIIGKKIKYGKTNK